VYLLPAIPVLGTAGRVLDNEYFARSQSLQQTGIRNGYFVGAELNFGI